MIKYYIFIFLILVLFSCKRRSVLEQENKYIEIENRKKIDENRKKIDEEKRIKRFIDIERIKNYKNKCDTLNSINIYNQLNDTIKKWVKLDYYFLKSYLKKRDILTLSKYIYFNNNKDKLIAFMLSQSTSVCNYEDRIYNFIGEKINGVWWFYYTLEGFPEREEYTKSEKKMIPLDLLNEIAIISNLNTYASEYDNYISDENFEKIEWEAARERYLIQDEKNN